MINFSRLFERTGRNVGEEQALRPVSPVSSLRVPVGAPSPPQPAAGSSSGTTPNLSRDSSGLSDWEPSTFYRDSIPLDDCLHNSSDISELNVLGLSHDDAQHKRSSIRRVPVGSKASVTTQSSNNDMRESWGREALLSSPDTLVGSPPPPSGRGRRWSGFDSFKSRIARNQNRRHSGFEALKSNVVSISEEERGGAAEREEYDDESFYKKFGMTPHNLLEKNSKLC